jgi:hypothetical protein
MNVVRALPESIVISFQDQDWIQPIDYEHIPFRCRKCHEHGHLYRECPQNSSPEQNKGREEKYGEGFTKIPNKRKEVKKGAQNT